MRYLSILQTSLLILCMVAIVWFARSTFPVGKFVFSTGSVLMLLIWLIVVVAIAGGGSYYGKINCIELVSTLILLLGQLMGFRRLENSTQLVLFYKVTPQYTLLTRKTYIRRTGLLTVPLMSRGFYCQDDVSVQFRRSLKSNCT